MTKTVSFSPNRKPVGMGRVEKSALASGTNLDEQVSGAYGEIKDILVELGVLEF